MKKTSKGQKALRDDASKSKANVPSQPTSTPPQTESGLKELLTDSLKNMYWAENHLVKSLPKMVNAARSRELKAALSEHRELTKEHAARLENALNMLGEKIQAKKCDACEGLVMSGEHVIENTEAGSEARDTGIIMSSLKVENFEITAYNGLIQLASTLGENEVAELLRQTLAEEKEADRMLTEMSGQQPTMSVSGQ